jgi:hypothetical protein
MPKIVGILLAVMAIWLGLEVYQNGIQGAFGGALARLDGSGDQQVVRDPRSLPQRAGDAVERAHAEAEARLNRLLGD